MQAIRDGLYAIVEGCQPTTVRHVFYRAVAEGLVDKTESQYKDTVGRLLVEMRREHQLPFGWLVDGTRWMRKPKSHLSILEAHEDTNLTYRKAIWPEQAVDVEIWVEKDAICGEIYEVTSRWDVPLMSTRGSPSLSFLHAAAEEMGEKDKPTTIFYLGDFDPTGVHIPKKIEADLREFAPDAELEFLRVAVTEEQIQEWDLPTRPTKKSDSRSKDFGEESVELDAVDPDTLRKLVEACITSCIDKRILRATRRIEALEKKTAETMDWSRLQVANGAAQ